MDQKIMQILLEVIMTLILVHRIQAVMFALFGLGMLLAPGAFIVLGLIIWIQRTKTGYIED